MSVLIDKCITCKSYDNEKNRVRNKLRCMIITIFILNPEKFGYTKIVSANEVETQEVEK